MSSQGEFKVVEEIVEFGSPRLDVLDEFTLGHDFRGGHRFVEFDVHGDGIVVERLAQELEDIGQGIGHEVDLSGILHGDFQFRVGQSLRHRDAHGIDDQMLLRVLVDVGLPRGEQLLVGETLVVGGLFYLGACRCWSA